MAGQITTFEVGKSYKKNVQPFQDDRYECKYVDDKYAFMYVTDLQNRCYPIHVFIRDVKWHNWSEIIPDKIITNLRYVYQVLKDDTIVFSPHPDLHQSGKDNFKFLRNLIVEYNVDKDEFILNGMKF